MLGKQFYHFAKTVTGFDEPETQTTLNEQKAIKRYATGKSTAVEIGVFEGFNTALIAESLSTLGCIFAIDPFVKGRLGLSYGKWITIFHLRRKGLLQKVNIIQKLSFDAADDVPLQVDFIFMDGDHSYDGIKKDWQLFSERVFKGGIIALHDTTAPSFQSWKSDMGSVLFFNDVIKHDDRFRIVETVDSLNILERK